MMKEVFECQNRYFKTKPRLVKRNATLVLLQGIEYSLKYATV